MPAKRALIVDDSKSARVVLSRMLEAYELEVDTANSAEDAITYLKAQRPDVIFMDHLMPGMDGFQAVQVIKNDSRTASIPICMYTSQEGELYVGQARALGAMGVLPKQIAPTDVSKVLYQLHLLPDRRDARPGPLQQIHTSVPKQPPGAGSAPAQVPPDVRAAVEPLLKEQATELRRFIVASLESFATRIGSETREYLEAAPLPEPPPRPVPPRRGWALAALVASLVAVASAAFALLEYRELATNSERAASAEHALAEARGELARKAAQAPVADGTADRAGAPPTGIRQMLPVSYGEVPLAGARLEALRGISADLERKGLAGTLLVTMHSADFCLTGNPGEGYALAPEDMPANRCDVVGNPYDDALRAPQRQSRAFADFIGTLPQRSQGALSAQVLFVGRSRPVVPYPPAAEASAAQWNAAAGANQRVDVNFAPRQSAP